MPTANVRASIYAVIGFTLLMINAFVISPAATGAVHDALDEALVIDDEDWTGDDWLNATAQRSYYAYDLTNVEAILNGSTTEMEWELTGPVIYNVTTHREVLMHDEANHLLTYAEETSFEWAGGIDPSTNVSNINILWDGQRIGATGIAMGAVVSFAQAAFTAGWLEHQMTDLYASSVTADGYETIFADLMENGGATSLDVAAMAHTAASYHAWNSSSEAQEAYNNSFIQGNPTAVTWSIPDFLAFAPSAYNTAQYGGTCVALRCDAGPLVAVSQGAPVQFATEVVEGSSTLNRATMLGYVALDENGTVDQAQTWARDMTIWYALAPMWANSGHEVDIRDTTDADLRDRFLYASGIDIDEPEVLDFLLFGWDNNTPKGLLESTSNGLGWGMANLLSAASDNPFEVILEYDLSLSEMEDLGAYAGDIFLGLVGVPTISLGVPGVMKSDEYAYACFGGIDPLSGAYPALGLNVAGLWPMATGHEVALNHSTVTRILEGPHGLLDNSVNFLYGEFSGVSVPMNETMMPETGGVQHVWNDTFVAELYEIELEDARALRYFVRDLIFNVTIGDLLGDMFGAQPYATMPIEQWLFGWRDPLVAQLNGDVDDPDLGWVSLEKNRTYIHSNNVSTESRTVITVNTGAGDLDEVGVRLLQDGSPYLPWRTPARDDATYGLLGTVMQAGVIGGSMHPLDGGSVNLVGYAVTDTEYVGPSVVHGLNMHEHHISLDPLENPIQAKLINSESMIDVFPGALPIYFGAEVEMHVEPTSQVIMSGKSQSKFYLDTRGVGAMNPSMDNLTPVFVIETEAGISAEDAATFDSLVVTNAKPFLYWTNMDTGPDEYYIDQVTLGIWVVGDLFLLAALITWLRGDRDELAEATAAEAKLRDAALKEVAKQIVDAEEAASED